MSTRRSARNTSSLQPSPPPPERKNTKGKNTKNSTMRKSTALKGKGPAVAMSTSSSLNKEEEALLTFILKRKKQTLKDATASENQAIQEKNRALLVQDQLSKKPGKTSEEDEAPPPAKCSKSQISFSAVSLVDEDEAAFAPEVAGGVVDEETLQWSMDLDKNTDDHLDYEANKHGKNRGEDQEDGDNEDNEDDDNSKMTADFGGGKQNDETPLITSSRGKKHRHMRSQSSTPSTTLSSGGSGKIHEADFPTDILPLAQAAKSRLRYEIAIVNACSTGNHEDLISSILRMVVQKSPQLLMALKMVENDSELQDAISKFVWYGCSGILNSIAKKARDAISSFYGIPGKLSTQGVIHKVQWLLHKSKFMYGGTDYENHSATHVSRRSYVSSGFQKLGKADIQASQAMVKEKRVVDPILNLTVCVIENTLKEWASGEQNQIKFRDQAVHPRYLHHQGTWKMLAGKAPSWAEKCLQSLFLEIMSHNKTCYLIEEENDQNGGKDLDDINFAELEASVVNGVA
ncbi:hypothetical protein L208DRAFT_1377094 [Tricholoma matsutake]|nr:hypothetical protein L208DRAFT_1377094 [Tricholoma matsutake 945]